MKKKKTEKKYIESYNSKYQNNSYHRHHKE